MQMLGLEAGRLRCKPWIGWSRMTKSRGLSRNSFTTHSRRTASSELDKPSPHLSFCRPRDGRQSKGRRSGDGDLCAKIFQEDRECMNYRELEVGSEGEE